MSATGLVVRALGLTDKSLADELVTPRPQAVLYAMAVSALLIGVLRVRDLIGMRTFTNLILGRYHRPRSEERISCSSTSSVRPPMRRSTGTSQAQELLKDVFETIAETDSPTPRSDRRLYWRSGDHFMAADAGRRAGEVQSTASSRSEERSAMTVTDGQEGSDLSRNFARLCMAAVSSRPR